MICNWDLVNRCFLAAGRGPLGRVILAEGDTRIEATKAWTEMFAEQAKEEQAMAREYEESARADHISDSAYRSPFGRDLG